LLHPDEVLPIPTNIIVGRAVAQVLKENNVTMSAFCVVIVDVSGSRELL
jgi:hypothetical protein